MSWDSTYNKDKKVWGDKPSELALFAEEHLKQTPFKSCRILDIGCGYGRDALYLNEKTGDSVLGIDCSPYAVRMANDSLALLPDHNIRFLCTDFDSLKEEPFDRIFASNLYQVLHLIDRVRFRGFIRNNLKPDGLLFMSTMAVGDPEHYGKGKPVEGDDGSFQAEKYLHFCNRQEIARDFSFLYIKELIERDFYEPRSDGATHHHKSWLFMGLNASI